MEKETEEKLQEITAPMLEAIQIDLEKALKKSIPNPGIVDLQILANDYDLVAFMAKEGAISVPVQIKKKHLKPVSQMISRLPEPKTKAAIEKTEAMISEIESHLLNLLWSSWKKIENKDKKLQIYARMEDAEEALDFRTGKMIQVSEYEHHLAPASNVQPTEIEYEELSKKVKDRIPEFFPDGWGSWAEDKIWSEIDSFFDAYKAELNNIEGELKKTFSEFIQQQKNPVGHFIDLRVIASLSTMPRIYYWVVPKGFTGLETMPFGIEIPLGSVSPFAALDFLTSRVERNLSEAGSIGQDVVRELYNLNLSWGLRRMILLAWQSAAPSGFLKAAVRDSSYDNLWIDEESPETRHNLKAIIQKTK